jgi:glycosyltransferase involved in cell wall biosynthesis
VDRAPDVTVVIPTRNRWDLLSTASLPSALGQQGVRVEVVVVDEGSTDATAAGLAALDDSRLRVVQHERPQGVARARNAGIDAARGEWVAFLDDDDLWAPWKLRAQLVALQQRDAVLAYAGAAAIAEDRSWLYSLAPADPDRLASELLSRNVLWGGSSNVVARSSVLRELGGFDEQLFQLCDWDLWIRLTQAGSAASCREILVGCIVHPDSMLLTSRDDVFEEFDYLERKHASRSASTGVSFDRRLFSQWVARGHRRAGRRLRAAELYLRQAVHERDLESAARAAASLLGEGVLVRAGRLLGRAPFEEEFVAPGGEPAWLRDYRRARGNTSAAAIRSANSPTES